MFEWDEAERQRNLTRHGVDFVDVLGVFADPARVEAENGHHADGEPCHVILCPVQGRLLHVTAAMRRASRRLIAARLATKREHEAYARYRQD